MQPDTQELSRTFLVLQDAEIASLYAQIDTLSDDAQIALRTEIERRHLSREQLLQLCSSQLRQEDNFDRRERARRMRALKRIGINLFSVAALLALLLIVDSVLSRPPKQSKITSDFRAHRAAYEQVRMMLLEDKGVDTVAPWGVRANDSLIEKMPPDGGMPVKRYQEYLALLKEIGAERADQIQDPPETEFAVWGSGWGGDTRHIAVCWLDREPSNTMTSLDAFYQTPKPRTPVYIHIDGNWYIWADW